MLAYLSGIIPFLVGLWVAISLTLIWLVYLMWRNEAVFRYRHDILSKLYEAAQDDINNRRSWQWRFEQFNAISYNAMLFHFWRKLDSFYPDRSFLYKDIKTQGGTN